MLALDGLTISQSMLVLGLPWYTVVEYRRRLYDRLGVNAMEEVIELWLRT